MTHHDGDSERLPVETPGALVPIDAPAAEAVYVCVKKCHDARIQYRPGHRYLLAGTPSPEHFRLWVDPVGETE